MSCQISSFDIFDTLLVRRWGRPVDLFVELGERLSREGLTNLSPQEWGRHRQSAESRAREETPAEEVTLDEIYRRLAVTTGMDPLHLRAALQMEIELEKESLVVVPEMREHLRGSRELGHRILFVSDMYLPVEVVTDILTKYELMKPEDKLYLSSEILGTKASGTLFRYALTSECVEPHQVRHVGDNDHSDMVVPQRLGMTAEAFTRTRLNSIEEYICQQEQLPLRFRSLVAGASRLARISHSTASHSENIIAEATAGVVAPVLFGFVFWCLMQARALNLKRLYFVSRDGQILLKTAKILTRAWNLDIECRYLYGSRHAWHVPAMTELGEEEFAWIFASTQFLSVRSVFSRLGFEPEAFCEILQKEGFSKFDWDSHLGNEDRARLQTLITTDGIRQSVLANSARLRDSLLNYLHQEEVADVLPFAIVDVGWNGRLQYSLQKVLGTSRLKAAADFHGLYFGLLGRSPTFSAGRMHAYFADGERAEELRLLQGHIPVLEQFFAADHGGVAGYRYDGEKFVPILRSLQNDTSLEWGLEVQQEVIVSFVKRLSEVLNPQNCAPGDFLPLSKSLLEFFLTEPAPDIAEVFGKQLISEDQAEDRYYVLAPQFSFMEAMKYAYSGQLKHNNQWLEASIQRSGCIPRFLVSLFKYPIRKRVENIGRQICIKAL